VQKYMRVSFAESSAINFCSDKPSLLFYD